MGFPADLKLVAVSGTVLNPADGSPASGTVTFAMPYPLVDTTGHVIVGDAPIVAQLVNGSFTVNLPATDQSQVRPLNWVYTITINTAAGYTVFQAALPQSPASTTLDQLVPVVTPPTVGIYLPLTMLGQPGGAASLDGTGKLPVSQLPSGGGVPDATPTSKGVLELAGDIAGTATAVQVTGTHLAAPLPIAQGGTGSATQTWELTANKGAANGYPSLDSGSKVPIAQLPTGTSSTTVAAGNDTRITGALQSSVVTAKGDLLVATGNATVNRHAVGSDGQLLTADSTQPDGIKWAPAPAAGVTSVNTRTGAVTLTKTDVGLDAVDDTADLAKPSRPLYPLQAYGYHSGSIHPDNINTASTLQEAFWSRIWVPGGFVINKIGTIVKTAGTWNNTPGLNGFAIYSDDGQTQLWTSALDDTMWQVAGEVSKTLGGSAITAPAGGAWYRCAMSSRNYSAAPVLHYMNTASTVLPDLGGRHAWYLAVASWPPTFTPATYGNNTGGYMPLLLLG